VETFEQLEAITEALRQRWPGGDAPFPMVARLLEESGELASEVNIFEATGEMHEKRGGPSKERLAAEARDAIVCALTIVAYYDAMPQLRQAIQKRYERFFQRPEA
jgi:NTP pyrophosphatase (non-canonical NTP hydrolase)